MNNLTLKQLRGFVAVAGEHSFTRAARRLNVSQSALTIAIQELELEVGAPLFDRTTRSVDLTAQGLVFLPQATRLLNELGQSLEDLRAITDRRSGSVVVAANSSFISVVLAPAVAALAAAYPNIAIRLTEDVSQDVLSKVLNGEADFGIATLWRPMGGLEGHMLLRDKLGVLCRKDHPLAAKRESLAWPDVAAYPIVSLEAGAGIRAMLDNTPKIASVLPRPRYEVSTVASVMALIRNGVGVAVFPAIAADPSIASDLIFIPVQKPALLRELFFAKKQHRSLTPAAKELAQHMYSQLQKLVEGPHVRLVPGNRDWLQ